jgi:hypothetical protein
MQPNALLIWQNVIIVKRCYISTSEEKVHDGTDVIVLQIVTYLMAMKSKYNFLN